MMKTFILFTAILMIARLADGQSGNPQLKAKTDDSTGAKKNGKNKAKIPADAGDDDGPTFNEVLAELKASYNKIAHVDKTVIDGKDTLQLHETYYCLHDHSLVVPKMCIAAWGLKHPKPFIANTFATKIVVIDNRDTVLNRVFKRVDFNSALWDRLRQYAIIFSADYIGYDRQKHEFAMGYSITIPLTDVGLAAGVAIDKKGKYRILDEYAQMDVYKKD
jgi:hypothetical protein